MFSNLVNKKKFDSFWSSNFSSNSFDVHQFKWLIVGKMREIRKSWGKNPLIQRRIHKELTHENIFMNVHNAIYLNTH